MDLQKCRHPPCHRWIDLKPAHGPLRSGTGATDDQHQLSPPMPPSPPQPGLSPTRQRRHLTSPTVGRFNGICNKRSLTHGIHILEAACKYSTPVPTHPRHAMTIPNNCTPPQEHDPPEQDALFNKPSHPHSGVQLKHPLYNLIHPKCIKPTSQGQDTASIGGENRTLSSRFGQS